MFTNTNTITTQTPFRAVRGIAGAPFAGSR